MGRKKFVFLGNGRKVYYTLVVNKEKGKVSALAQNCEFLGMDATVSVFHSVNSVVFEEDCLLYNNLLMNSVYVGTARLKGPDVFDVKKGEEIAAGKLKEKLDAAVCSRMRMLAKEFRRMADDLKLRSAFSVPYIPADDSLEISVSDLPTDGSIDLTFPDAPYGD